MEKRVRQLLDMRNFHKRPVQYKQSKVKRGQGWIQIVDIPNSIASPYTSSI